RPQVQAGARRGHHRAAVQHSLLRIQQVPASAAGGLDRPVIQAIVYALIFYPATFLYVLACMVASLLGSKPMRAVVHAWTDLHHNLAKLLGTRLVVEGSIPPGSSLIAVKHQSMFETLEMVRLAKTPGIVLKRG